MSLRSVAKTTEIHSEHVAIGHDILGLISSAMYVQPLTVYRELLQNATDAVDEAVRTGQLKQDEGMVTLTIDPLHRTILVRDNGAGVSNEGFARTMCAIGASPKRGEKARGFRGIGRLVGLGYAQHLVFRSRSSRTERVMEASWDCRLLKDLLRNRIRAPLAEVVAEVVTIIERSATADEPDHFFDVELRKVARLADDALLDAAVVERYLSEVAPVPFSGEFSYGGEIARKLVEYDAFPTVRVHINGSAQTVARPYRNTYPLSASKTAEVKGIQFLEIPRHDGAGIAAVAWIAEQEYLGAFPRRLGVRGIRARVGNLQVGDERIFASAFPEERFSDWCLGEVYILDERIVPNGRRDDFEPNQHFANLINHLSVLGRQIAKSARTSSIERRNERGLSSVELSLREYRKLLKKSPEAFELRSQVVEEARADVAKARRRAMGADRKRWESQIASIERLIDALAKVERPLGRKPNKRELGHLDVLRLLRKHVAGGSAATTRLLKILAADEAFH